MGKPLCSQRRVCTRVCTHTGEECAHTHTCASFPGTQAHKGKAGTCARVCQGRDMCSHACACTGEEHVLVRVSRKGCTLPGEGCAHGCEWGVVCVHTWALTRGGHTLVYTHRLSPCGRQRVGAEGSVSGQKAACCSGKQRVRACRAGVKAAVRVKWGVRARPGASAAPAACSPSVALMPSAADSPAGAAAAGGWGSSARQNH